MLRFGLMALLVLLGGCSTADDGGTARSTSASSPVPTSPATAPTSSVPVGGATVAFIGDSWTHGVGATDLRGFPVLTAELLGWNFTELGESGSGYVVPGGDGPFATRIPAALAADPDVVVVQGSLNEQGVDADELESAALDTLTRLRQEADPATEILVVGAPDAPGTDADLIDRVNAAVSAAAESVGLRFVDPAEWTDPGDAGLWSDPVHPDDDGHRAIAEHLAPLLAELVER